MLKIDMLPAGYGDCLWIEYGRKSSPRRILIDGGLAGTYKHIRERILTIPEGKRHFELFIITHVDADHIEGAIKLLGAVKTLGITFGDVWFNGWKHLDNLPDDDALGAVQGEFLSALIKKRRLPWNEAFGGEAVMVPREGPLPTKELRGGMRLTLLSPTLETLRALRAVWDHEVEEIGLDRSSVKAVLEVLRERRNLRVEDELGEEERMSAEEIDVAVLADEDIEEDDKAANGSSIAVLAEFEDPEDRRTKRCLLTGDAFPSVLRESLGRLEDAGGPVEVDLLKLPHHGSKNNVSRDLLEAIKCNRYLFSTNGKSYGHPSPQGVARVIVYGRGGGGAPSLVFNYRSEINEVWESPALEVNEHTFTTLYPESAQGGVSVTL